MLQAMVMLSRQTKIAIMVANDTVLLLIGLWLALSLRYGLWWFPTSIEQVVCLVVATMSGVSAFAVLGLYQWMVRYVSVQTVSLILRALVISALILSTSIMFLRVELPRSTPIIYILVASALVIASRFAAQYYLRRPMQKGRVPIIIYGAGVTGTQLALTLHQSHDFRPVAFVDDTKRFNGMMVYGLKIYHPEKLAWLIAEYDVEQVLLAIPSLTQSRRREVLLSLEKYETKVSTVPAMNDILSGRARLDEIKEVDIEDLLGRDVVPPDASLMSSEITQKNVLITGAGGSIGSELCRQIIALAPQTLVLYEQGEYALYVIDQELQKYLQSHPSSSVVKVVAILGSVQNQQRITEIFSQFAIQTVFHAAAYKHVPLVEANIIEGVYNNVFGTLSVVKAALATKVKTFVLISTDKAVRPTNIMGATKRLAELILQAFSQDQTDTCFCMVRFGNVLGSSGSVVPLFKEQIRHGGPVTVTHPDVIRYFMTIPEAAQLVVQTSAMAKGGDVFLLDMGEPVRIADLAKKMIHLMGCHVKEPEQPEGVAIKYTGLRAGEKLYEELLVGGEDEATSHPRIRRAFEHSVTKNQLHALLTELQILCEEQKRDEIYEFFSHLGIGFVCDYKRV